MIFQVSFVLVRALGGRLAAAIGTAAGTVLCLSTMFAASIIGGLMLGYGARIAYGCNIGALFSGIASSSVHGWLWLVSAFVGNVLGTRVRPMFGLRV